MSETTPRILVLSENLQLAGLLLVRLAKLQREGQITLVGAWTDSAENPQPMLAKAEYERLLNASRVTVPRQRTATSAAFDGVVIPDFPTLCSELGVKHHTLLDVNSSAVSAGLRGLNVDLGIVCGHAQIFREPLLKATRRGWVNAHPSLLPRYRGPMPGFWELRGGEEKSGVSIHLLNQVPDGGPLLAQEVVPLDVGDSFFDLIERQANLIATLMPDAVLGYLRGEIVPVEQSGEPSVQGMPGPDDMAIDPAMGARQVASFVFGMRDIAPVILSNDDQLWHAESVVEWNESSVSKDRVGECQWLGCDRLRLWLRDGSVTLLVSSLQFADESGDGAL